MKKSAKQSTFISKAGTVITAIAALVLIAPSQAENFTWPNKTKAAIVLSYDDTLNSHLDNAIPQLDSHKFSGTFYISGAKGQLDTRMTEWRAAASNGHELANHTLYHPCQKSKSGRDWVQSYANMDTYTLNQFLAELKVTNTLLQAIDGKTKRTFAYTCGDTQVGGQSIIEAIKPVVTAARSTISGYNNPQAMDFYQIKMQDGANKNAEQLIAMVEIARKNNALVVFLFHGVGGDYLSVDSQAHQQLLDYLNDNKKDYWVAPLQETVTYIQSQQ
ncbi:MAG: polysaccharide deacetylase family protein [Colwellia sp.]